MAVEFVVVDELSTSVDLEPSSDLMVRFSSTYNPH